MNTLRRLGHAARAALRARTDRWPAAVDAHQGERKVRDVLR